MAKAQVEMCDKDRERHRRQKPEGDEPCVLPRDGTAQHRCLALLMSLPTLADTPLALPNVCFRGPKRTRGVYAQPQH